jgi:hypothetical protein
MLMGVLSIVPLPLLIAVSILEPWLLHRGGLGNRELISGWADTISLACGVITIVVLAVFLAFVYRSADPRLVEKKALWTSVLLFANVFALPIFWFKFLRR